MAKHLITLLEWSPTDIQHVLDLALDLRGRRERAEPATDVLRGKTLAMLFEKPSLRTRVSFEQAMLELGGHAIILGEEVGIGKRESVADVTRVLAGMVHGIAARVFEHEKLRQMAQHSDKPVINMLSDYSHPCQALADALTMIDAFGTDLAGRTLAYVGDGNNVARSLAVICGKLGMRFAIATPPGYELEQEEIDRIMAALPSMDLVTSHDPMEVVHDADAIYTDTWVSMGQEQEKQQKLPAFKDFVVNQQMLAGAPKHAIVLHCLPAYRGTEITDAVMDGPQSRVFAQAHNRLHAQKGLLAMLMAGQ